MALLKAKKQEIYKDLQNIVKDSASVVFLNFHGLNVADTTKFRRALRESKVGYTVAKKKLTKKAFSEMGIKGDMPELTGELGIAYSKELTDGAREVYSFQKKFENKIKLLGGIFEGKYMSMEEMTVIASIPGMQTLRAQFVNVINSPISGLVVALGQIVKKREVVA